MIDNLISDPTKQIWINLSCIFKVMNFIIFRIFLQFFRIYLNLFLISKRIKKCFYISRADVSEHRHVAVYVCVCTFTRVGACAHVCACV